MPALNQASGELTAAIASIRRKIDSPAINSKYSNDDIVQEIMGAWNVVMPDLYAAVENPPMARYSLTVVDGTNYYYLPVTVGQIHVIAERDTNGRIVTEYPISNTVNPYCPYFKFEGNQRVWVDPDVITPGKTVEILYTPSGDITMVAGTVPVSGLAVGGLTLGATATESVGAIDRRPNAYVGGMLNITGYSGPPPTGYIRFPIQQRVVSSYSVATGLVSITPNFDTAMTVLPPVYPEGTISYEIYPLELAGLWTMLIYYAAMTIAVQENHTQRAKNLAGLFANAKKAVLLSWSTMNMRTCRTISPNNGGNPDWAYGSIE